MSIIQEALKKAQNYIESQKPQKEVESAVPVAAMEKKSDLPQSSVTEKKSLNTTSMLLILLVVLAFIVTKQFFFAGKTEKKSLPKRDPGSYQEVAYKPIQPKIEAPASPELKKADETKRLEEAKFSLNLKDITHGALGLGQYPKFILNGIMSLNNAPKAIINDSMVGEGDIIGGAKVIKIGTNNVVLNLNDLEITLILKK